MIAIIYSADLIFQVLAFVFPDESRPEANIRLLAWEKANELASNGTFKANKISHHDVAVFEEAESMNRWIQQQVRDSREGYEICNNCNDLFSKQNAQRVFGELVPSAGFCSAVCYTKSTTNA